MIMSKVLFKMWLEAEEFTFKQRIFNIPVYHVTKAKFLEQILRSGLKKSSDSGMGGGGVYGPAVYASINFDEQRSFGTEEESDPELRTVVLEGDLDIKNFLIQGVVAPSVCSGPLDICVYGMGGIQNQIKNLYPEAPEEWKKSIHINPQELSMYFRHDTRCPGMLIDHSGTFEGNWAVIYNPSRLAIKRWKFVDGGEWQAANDVRGLHDERKADAFRLAGLRSKIKLNPYGSLYHSPVVSNRAEAKPKPKPAPERKSNNDLLDVIDI